ncbi:hypothetical protein GZL_p00012 (plasmid) [Streptomyces sp. 769]|nr:hypothetical protein GZL_p00012 [Streptomyces sp. 769]
MPEPAHGTGSRMVGEQGRSIPRDQLHRPLCDQITGEPATPLVEQFCNDITNAESHNSPLWHASGELDQLAERRLLSHGQRVCPDLRR